MPTGKKEPRNIGLRVLVNKTEKDRIDAYLNHDYTEDTNMSELGRVAIFEFLDREERILELAEDEFKKIETARGEIAKIRKNIEK